MRGRWPIALGSTLLFFSMASAAEPSSVVLNEVYYDAPGSDTGNEWVELLNAGGATVDLAGWKIDRGGTTFSAVFTFPDGAGIAPGAYLLVGEAAVSGAAFTGTFAFQNGGEATDGIRLVDRSGAVVDVVLYDEPNTNGLPDRSGNAGTSFAPDVAEGHSLARLPNGSGAFADAKPVTPGAENADGGAVVESVAPSPTAAADVASAAGVVVNEVLPNPAGADEEGEFVELWNSGSATANLSGFSVDDADGGSPPHAFPSGTTVAAKGFFVLRRPETHLAFNNDADHARLLRPDTSVQHELVFDDAPSGEGHAFARKSNGSAAWTDTPTPGVENRFTSAAPAVKAAAKTATAVPSKPPSSPTTLRASPVAGSVRGVSEGSRSVSEAARAAPSGMPTTRRNASASPTAAEEVHAIPLADVRSLDLGARVRVEGIVSAVPGALDERLFYLAGSGIGVVVPDGDLPSLALGDLVEVTGVLKEPRKERFIVVAPEDVVKKESRPAPGPHDVRTGEIGEAYEGSLVRVRGRVSRVEDRTFRIDDGSGAARVASVPSASVREGASVSVNGIVTADDEGYRVFPRAADDIVAEPESSGRRSPLWRRPLLLAAAACFLAAAALVIRRRLRAAVMPV
jgi:lamin tail-like protein